MNDLDAMNITYSDKTVKKSLTIFHLLRNEVRFKILWFLLEKECNVSELEHKIKESQSSISHQLSLLKKNQLIKSRRVGRKQYYQIYDKHIQSIIYLALHHAKEKKDS